MFEEWPRFLQKHQTYHAADDSRESCWLTDIPTWDWVVLEFMPWWNLWKPKKTWRDVHDHFAPFCICIFSENPRGKDFHVSVSLEDCQAFRDSGNDWACDRGDWFSDPKAPEIQLKALGGWAPSGCVSSGDRMVPPIDFSHEKFGPIRVEGVVKQPDIVLRGRKLNTVIKHLPGKPSVPCF